MAITDELKPCPFCGETDIDTAEGSTFRWMYAYCTNCGAQSGAIRIDTMNENRDAAIEKGSTEAIAEWNRRTEGAIAGYQRGLKDAAKVCYEMEKDIVCPEECAAAICKLTEGKL